MSENNSARDPNLVFDKFLQGKDKLSALLRATPHYEPPTDMANAFAAWAKTAQSIRMQAEYTPAEQPLSFEPPPQLEQSFLREAAAIQAAQAPRREAVLQQLAEGQTAEAVLGADVTTATRAWLDRQQAERISAASAAVKPKGEHIPRRQVFPRSALAFSVALIAGIAMNTWLRPSAPRNIQTAALSPAPALIQKTTPPAAAQPNASLAARPAAARASGTLAPLSPQKDLPQRAGAKPVELAKLSPPPMPANAEIATQRESGDALKKSDETTSLVRSDTAAPALAVASAAVAATTAASEPAAPPPALAAPRAAPDPLGTMAKVSEAALPTTIFNASLNDDAKQVADKLLANNATTNNLANPQGKQLWIMTTSPESPRVKEWAEKLRLALPTAVRPIEIQLQTDAQLPPESLRIELR